MVSASAAGLSLCHATIQADMTQHWDVIGIALQLVAGFLFLLRQFSDGPMDRASKWIRKLLGMMTGDVQRRWRIPLAGAPIGILAMVTLLLLYGGNNEGMTIATIVGGLVYILIGAVVYLYLLRHSVRLTEKLTLMENLTDGIYDRKLLIGNAFLLVSSAVLVLVLFWLAGNLASRDGLLYTFFTLVFVFGVALLAFPLFVASGIFLYRRF